MTARELVGDVGQLLWVGFRGTEAPDYLRRAIAGGKVGAAVLFRRNLVFEAEVMSYASGAAGALPDVGGAPGLVAQAAAGEVGGGGVAEATATRSVVDVERLVELIGQLRDAVPAGGDSLLVAVDQEGGRVQRVKAPATLWPPMLSFDELDDARAVDLSRQVGRAMGEELAALGFDIDFAPVLDVHTNPDNPIIGDRAFATEAGKVADRALAFAEGLASSGVIGCGKHFPGHGDTHEDSHLALPRVDHPMERLRAVELEPFRRAAIAELPMLMTAHVVFAALDADRPATLSPAVVGDLLRKELGYRGLVVSDDLDMKAIADRYGAGDAAVQSISAGCDALLLCCDVKAQHEAFEGLVHAAETSSELRRRIGESAARVRELKRGHESARPGPRADPRAALGTVAFEQLARELRRG